MTIHKDIQSKCDLEGVYVSRKEEVKVLASTEDCVDITNRGLKEYTKSEEKDQLKQPVTAMSTPGQTLKKQKIENKNKKIYSTHNFKWQIG